MGHYVSDNSTASGGGSGALQALTTAFIAGEAISQGKVVTLGGDNLVYYAVDPTSPAAPAAWRPLNQAATSYGVPQGPAQFSSTTATSTSGGYNTAQKAMCQLSNGNAAIISLGSADSTLKIAIFASESGQQILPLTTVDTAANVNYSIAALKGGGFAIADYTATFLTVKTFDNAGNPTGSVTTAVATSTAQPNLTPLSNGNFVLSYLGVSNTTYAAIFSNICAVVLASFQVNAAQTNQFNTIVAALAGGGFVVYFATSISTSASGQTAFIIYSNSGAVVKALTNVVAAFGPQYMNAVGLSGGGFAVCTNATASNAGLALAIYNAAGVQQGVTYTDAAGINNNTSLAAAIDGSLYAMYQAASTLVLKLSAAGVKIGNTLPLAYQGQAGGGVYPWLLAPSPDGGAVAFTANSTAVSVAYISASLVQTYAAFQLPTPNSLWRIDAFVYQPASCPNPCFAMMTFSNGNSAAMNMYALKVQKQVAIGVSIASAAAQSALPLQFTGNFTLAAAWAQPYVVNYQSNSPPGQRMNIVGNMATMYGMQPGDSRRQIN